MATLKARGTSHNVIFPFTDEAGRRKQQWEAYTTELEALQRKAFIDYLQKNRKHDELLVAVNEYRKKRADEKAALEAASSSGNAPSIPVPTMADNTKKTYREFAEKWLPFHARKKRFSPNTYDSYVSNLNNHILPVFGDRVMSTITSEDIDNFVDSLSKKPVKGHRSYNQKVADIPTLSSGAIKKCYNVLTAGLPVAKTWRYINEVPVTTAPIEKTKKRKAWDPQTVYEAMAGIEVCMII